MSRYPEGAVLIKDHKCPRHQVVVSACMVCCCGHICECHYPMVCEEARCDHYKIKVAEDQAIFDMYLEVDDGDPLENSERRVSGPVPSKA